MNISTALQAKAERLVQEDRILPLRGYTYQVEGDSGFHTVMLSDPATATGRCTCPSTSAVCSHLLAVAIFYLADPPTVTVPTTDPFEGLN